MVAILLAEVCMCQSIPHVYLSRVVHIWNLLFKFASYRWWHLSQNPITMLLEPFSVVWDSLES